MKHLFLFLILLSTSLASYNQEIVTVDSTFARDPYIHPKDSGYQVYRLKEADKIISTYEHKIKPGDCWYNGAEIKWGLVFFDKVISKDLQQTLLRFPEEIRVTKNSFYVYLYYDVAGRIISIEYIIGDSVREQVSDQQLNLLYQDLMKEKFVFPYQIADTEKERMKLENERRCRSNEIFYEKYCLIKYNRVIHEMKNVEKDTATWNYVKKCVVKKKVSDSPRETIN